MMSITIFIGMTLLLILEGYLLSYFILPRHEDHFLRVSFGLPLSSLVCVLSIMCFTIIGAPISHTNLIIFHSAFLLFIFLFLFLKEPYFKTHFHNIPSLSIPRLLQRVLITICSISLLLIAFYSVAHSFILPTYYYDSATNWNMRSKISFTEQQMIFNSLDGLIRKPDYPPLYHSLQLHSHIGQNSWSEPIANGSHALLMISSFAVFFLLLRRLRGSSIAFIALTLIVSTPLITLHTGQQYADITLVCFALLSLLSLAHFAASHNNRWLVTSSLFISACVWTKAEGLFFCFVPWLILLYVDRSIRLNKSAISAVVPGIVVSLLWPTYLLSSGRSFTPHGADDLALSVSDSSVLAFTNSLFIQGSFGIMWCGIFTVLIVLILKTIQSSHRIERHYLQLLLWPLLTFIGYTAVFLGTSNADYLISGQSFDRQMLLTLALFITSFVLILKIDTE